eukprot:CAMPEP_0114386736 /NCGR_PEP_ID=MMETSP0102-20121206/6810_1 /TAXON_ID=38822 ORGANISM="Pteridomonas danica, Strain PT" /NCGR_SAMPLE_ID=MMETSP0102 /ASSEMBLY_ACC=CAM_ASM_000212 /LENGTH=488 /DNA_ID=CAMNT_0001543641 /DNA_START=34 /DNA_END=1497 /DNA_ORIENTATION=+
MGGFATQIEDMFNVSDPEEAGKLAITVLAIMICVSLLFYAISILCLAGEAICCVVSLCKCLKNMCSCCAKCCMPKKKDGETNEGSGENGEVAHSSSSSSHTTRNVGQLMSLILMVVSILLALVWEFYFAEGMENSPGTSNAWTSPSCNKDSATFPQCVKYQAAYRVAFVAVFFFFIMAIVTTIRPDFHDRGWDLKITCYILLIVGVTFLPNEMFDQHGFLWVARIFAFIFLILQQVILIDSAYCLNEYLVEKGYASADRPGTEDGAWNFWLVACLLLSIFLFAVAITGIVLLLVYYTGCDNSNTFIAFTLIGVVAFTILQLFFTKPDENNQQGHNLLTTSAVAAYVVYLCFVGVSANPVESCNPMYSQRSNTLALILGLGITFISVTGTVYFSAQSMTGLVTTATPVKSPDLEQVLTGEATTTTDAPNERPSLTRQVTGGLESNDQYWKFNAVMALIGCYWCCVLTDWGNAGGGASAASPTAGTTAMW